ncbi:hypothetical protein B296_00031267 [Ensete ventricosum]|uniref:Uncharacterized protein n=1 Tax=Ensete ventricosum TaxID=4639 RepID=A0A426X6I8_ENSVE|nr:hypothetical protein B296_00031267 [Ensete ventricosum]
MRLNRVESFYTFLLHFRNKGSEEEGRPTIASPHVGPTTHGQAAARASTKGSPTAPTMGDSRPQGQQPVGDSRLQHDARKGGRLQGARKGLLPAANPTASRGSGASRRGGRPLAGRLPACKGSRCLRRGNDDGAEGKEGLGHPLEKRMILPL